MIAGLMVLGGAGVMILIIALAVSRSEINELNTKLESQRQKREIDEGKRCELRSQLDTALLQIEALQRVAGEARTKADSPRNAVEVLERFVTGWENA